MPSVLSAHEDGAIFEGRDQGRLLPFEPRLDVAFGRQRRPLDVYRVHPGLQKPGSVLQRLLYTTGNSVSFGPPRGQRPRVEGRRKRFIGRD